MAAHSRRFLPLGCAFVPSGSFQFVAFVTGILLNVIATAMAVPAVVDYIDGNPDWQVFLASMAVTYYVGLSLMEANRGAPRHVTLSAPASC